MTALEKVIHTHATPIKYMKLSNLHVILSTFTITALANCAYAATLSGSLDSGSPFNSATSFDLSDLGTADWAYWDTSSGAGVSGAATNSMLSADLIGDLSAIGGGGLLKGTASATKPAATFTYDNGTSPSSGTATQVTGLFNSTINTSGTGVGLSIDLPTTDEYTIYLWVSAFDVAAGTLTVSLPDTTDYTFATISDSAGPDGVKDTYFFTITASATTAGDDLSISLVNTTDGPGNFGHIVFNSAAVAIPEPTTTAIFVSVMGLLFVVARKNRRAARS